MSKLGFRYLGSVSVAVGVTLSTFFAMHLLIRNDASLVTPTEAVASIRFERIDIVPEIDPEPPFVKPDRKDPEPFTPVLTPKVHTPIEPPPIEPPRVIQGRTGPGVRIGPPVGPRSPESTSDVSCLTRVSPQYPREMAMRGIEGQVSVAFTITEAGTVRDIQIVGSSPRGGFDEAARRAVARWTCEPGTVNGAAVEQRVTQIIDFKLDES